MQKLRHSIKKDYFWFKVDLNIAIISKIQILRVFNYQYGQKQTVKFNVEF